MRPMYEVWRVKGPRGADRERGVQMRVDEYELWAAAGDAHSPGWTRPLDPRLPVQPIHVTGAYAYAFEYIGLCVVYSLLSMASGRTRKLFTVDCWLLTVNYWRHGAMWNSVDDARAGAMGRGGDQGVREQEVRPAVRPVRQGERERRRRAPALPVAQVAPLGHFRRVRSPLSSRPLTRTRSRALVHLLTCSATLAWEEVRAPEAAA